MSAHGTAQPIRSGKCTALTGTITVPGDKSISHRSLILSSQAKGTSTITGLLEGEDVINTAKALRLLGIEITKDGDTWQVTGKGVGGLQATKTQLDMGNSGTGVRLMMGLVAPYDFETSFTGDKSLSSRPMRRVALPLEEMGAEIKAAEGYRLPLSIKSDGGLKPITYTLPVASAQVKSAILLAGLTTDGTTTVIEPVSTRDHTERMLRFFGADIDVTKTADGGKNISITGKPTLTAKNIIVPGDPSSAAFFVVAALIIPNSDLLIENICMNPDRIGLFTTLKEMGADITFVNERDVAGEPVADLHVKYSKLKGVTVPAERAPSMIDEYPILSVAASCAEGKTIMLGLEELRVKESDRLSAIAAGLKACGVTLYETEDSLTVEGNGTAPQGGGFIATHLDHRIAMSFLILGAVAKEAVTVDDGAMINTSFPTFIELLNKLGGKLEARNAA